MSRIAKQPIDIPSGVKVELDGNHAAIEGPNGRLTVDLPAGIKVGRDESKIMVSFERTDRKQSGLAGLSRTLLANMVQGVTKGFVKRLEISGVGYRAEVQGSVLNLSLGYSHPVLYPLPDGITVKVDKQTLLAVSGADKCLVGQVAANIRSFRKVEPYKGKGIRYEGEKVRRKAGKSGK